MARLTRKNPNLQCARDTYRIPCAENSRWSVEIFLDSQAVLGEVADKLGRYEDIGEPDEIEKKLQELQRYKKMQKAAV